MVRRRKARTEIKQKSNSASQENYDSRCLHLLLPYVECWLYRILARGPVLIPGVANGKRIFVVRSDGYPASD